MLFTPHLVKHFLMKPYTTPATCRPYNGKHETLIGDTWRQYILQEALQPGLVWITTHADEIGWLAGTVRKQRKKKAIPLSYKSEAFIIYKLEQYRGVQDNLASSDR